jgi:hypothetical protein
MGGAVMFPTNPKHGTVYELREGLHFKYDATVRSWVKIASNAVTLNLATTTVDGAMSAADLQKLNRLVLPPPISTIIGNDCPGPFQFGSIGLFGGDRYVAVDGNVQLENIDEIGDHIAKKVPFKIHQHTYGFDFTIDLPLLVEELKVRGQFNVVGKKGDTGAAGEVGDPGADHILSGPPGTTGAVGAAPTCALSVESDDLSMEASEGMVKAVVAVRPVRDTQDPNKYKLVFDRQTIGSAGYAADHFHVQSSKSMWVLAVTGDDTSDEETLVATPGACNDQTVLTGRSLPVFYIDIEPIIEAIRTRYLSQVAILKYGYENIVRFWLKTMSDLFDEQKVALCCAIEHCMSIKKNIDARQHDAPSRIRRGGVHFFNADVATRHWSRSLLY